MCFYRSRLVFNVAFKPLLLHMVVLRHTWSLVGSLVRALLQMCSCLWQWNKFENWCKL